MQGVIFDLDGTLADTAGDLLAAANVALEPTGLALLDPVDDRHVAGRGGRSMIRHAITKAGADPDGAKMLELTDLLYPILLEAYGKRLAVETRLYDGVERCLDLLEADGWKLGICTNKPEALAVALMTELGVLHRFGALLGADTLPVRKPDPEHLFETCRRVGADPSRSVLIGDTQTDRDTAFNANMPCILTTFGFAADPVASLAPEGIIGHFDELPPMLARMRADGVIAA